MPRALADLMDSPVDAAWREIAAEIQAENPGSVVTYGWMGFEAVRNGVRYGPASWQGITALLGGRR